MQRIFELPDGTHEAIRAQAQGDYLRALRLLRGLANDRYPASYDILAYTLQAVRSQTVTPATDGWFTAEPQRAALLRAAIMLHLPIVAFDMDEADHAWMEEHPDESGEFREQRMAEHIIERVLQKEPAARVLI